MLEPGASTTLVPPLDSSGQDLLVGKILAATGIDTVSSPENVGIVRSTHQGVDYWFILNHSMAAQQVSLPARGIELLSGQPVTGTVTVPGLDALVIRIQAIGEKQMG